MIFNKIPVILTTTENMRWWVVWRIRISIVTIVRTIIISIIIMSVIAVHIKIWCYRLSNFFNDLNFGQAFEIFGAKIENFSMSPENFCIKSFNGQKVRIRVSYSSYNLRSFICMLNKLHQQALQFSSLYSVQISFWMVCLQKTDSQSLTIMMPSCLVLTTRCRHHNTVYYYMYLIPNWLVCCHSSPS